jgi:hypothetical protein
LVLPIEEGGELFGENSGGEEEEEEEEVISAGLDPSSALLGCWF